MTINTTDRRPSVRSGIWRDAIELFPRGEWLADLFAKKNPDPDLLIWLSIEKVLEQADSYRFEVIDEVNYSEKK